MIKLIRWIWIPILILVLGIVFFNKIVLLLSDWFFFQEVGYDNLFLIRFKYQLITFGVFFLITFIFVFINIFIASHISPNVLIRIPEPLSKLAGKIPFKIIRNIIFVISILFALFIGYVMSNFWSVGLQYLHAVPFQEQDPLFGFDISYFIFQMPLYDILLAYGQMILIITAIPVIILYIFTRSASLVFNQGWRLFLKSIDPQVRLHLGFLLILHFILTGIRIFLSIHKLVYGENIIFGASYTDDVIRIPLMYLSIIAAVVCMGSILLFALSARLKPFIVSIIVYVLITIFEPALPSLVQQFIVGPNELAKETPYIKKNIEATRKAYALDEIQEKSLSDTQELTPEDVQKNEVTLKNVRLWDRDPLLSTFSQIQEIRTYYEFHAIDNDRYMVDGEPRQIMLSARELFSPSLPNKNWINERLTFTHGYGIAASPVNQVTKQGLPVLFVKDIPPHAADQELRITQPELYYGEIPNTYVITNTKAKEFNYPKGEENVYTTYEGRGGVALDSFIKRLFFAFRFQSWEILLSDDITPKSRIMYNREIVTRIMQIAPFLEYDRDPYVVIADGKLYWMLDAYTTSARYPYAEPTRFNGREINYIRNAVKIVVDAYNGNVKFYHADKTDPLIAVLGKIYPGILTDIKKMPPALRAHIRYPQGIFEVQTEMYRTYHMRDIQNFYNKEDQWQIPEIASVTTAEQGSAIAPRHLVMKLPDEEREEYVLMLPYTPRGKDNLAAWIAARNDGEEYGKLVVYRFPKDSLVFGPKQVISRINQDAEISQQISLWDQRGSQVIQGPLLVIPIEQALLYVRPLYLQAESGRIPELKRVLVAYEDTIAMGETFEQALQNIFGQASAQEEDEAGEKNEKVDAEHEQQEQEKEQKNDTLISGDREELLKQARQYYDAAIQAQRNGNWAVYGENIEKLGEVLEEVEGE